MARVFRFALAMASLITVVAGATLGAGQAGRMDQMGQMNDFKPYKAEAVKAAMAEGKTTLLFFHAPWCPVCKAQEPKVKAHLNGAHKNVVAFKVDYDSNMALRGLLWSFGAGIQDENENVIINSDATIAAVEYMNELFSNAMTPEVFAWNAASNNQGINAGELSYILNSISAYRTAQDEGLVYVYLPKKYEHDWEHFAGVMTHLFLNESENFVGRKAAELKKVALEDPNAPLMDISYCLEGLGPKAIEVIEPLIRGKNQDVAFAAARAAAYLGNIPAQDELVKIAQTKGHKFQVNAVHVLGSMPASPAIMDKIRPLLDSSETMVRIAGASNSE